jgi:hypothetical protein
MTLQFRMTAICENEIVTLRGGACLVMQLPMIVKIAEIESETLNHRGHEGTQRKSEIREAKIPRWSRRARRRSDIGDKGRNSAADFRR